MCQLRCADQQPERPSDLAGTDSELGDLEQLLLERLLLLLQRKPRVGVQRRKDVAALAICRGARSQPGRRLNLDCDLHIPYWRIVLWYFHSEGR